MIQEYQKFVGTTSGAYKELTRDEGRLAAAGLGLVGEAGEASELIKKGIFHGHGTDVAALHKELGDVLWYVTELCNATGTTLEEVLLKNMDKLKRRYPDGFTTESSMKRKDESR